MKQKSLAYAKYWRICLADADLGKGALYRSDLEKLMLRPANELQNGRVDAELTQELFKHASQDVDEVEITIRQYIVYGPTMNAFDAADKNGKATELQKELEALFTSQNKSASLGTAAIPATFLRVTVTKH